MKLNKDTVWRGRAAQIAVHLCDEFGINFFTSGLTAAFLRIENTDGTFIEKAASTGIAWGIPDSNYLYVFPFTPDETHLFRHGKERSIWLKLVFGENSMKYEMKKFLDVLDDAF